MAITLRVVAALLASLAVATAMAPRNRRNAETSAGATSTSAICSPQTACGWSAYVPRDRRIDHFISNTDCVCAENMECVTIEDDQTTSTYVHRCRAPASDSDE